MIDLRNYDLGEHRIACPCCARNPKDRTLGISVRSIGNAVAHCFRCEYTQSLKERSQKLYTPTIKPQSKPRQRYTTLSDWGRSLWLECHPMSGIALDYLKNRKCAIPPSDGDLRWHPNLRHPSGVVGAALVGLVTDFVTGEPLSLHRTWITSISKANVEPNRMLLGRHAAQGGVIRLFPDECVTTGLGIAEGIETALSLAHEYTPVWAAVSAGNMASLPALDGVESLMIAVDQDDAGRSAAQVLAHRWIGDGREVFVMQVPNGDLNDHIEVCHD